MTPKIYLAALLFMGSYNLSFAQSSITGTVYSDQNEPVDFANVLLLNGADSTLIQAELTSTSGKFKLKTDSVGTFFLQITQLGYVESWLPISVTEKEDLDVGKVDLTTASEMLNTVEVTARKPLLEQRAGMLVVNVAQSLTSVGGTALDMLRKVPGLIVVNGRVNFAGKDGVTILIDGRPTQYMDIQSLLRDMPSSEIEKIEVISQPGAAFDAQGNTGVINIVLKRNSNLGWNGKATLGAGRGELWKYNGSLSLNKRNEKFNWTNFVAFNHRTYYEELFIDRVVGENRFQQVNQMPYIPFSGTIKTGLDFYLSEKSTVGGSIRLRGSRNDNTDNTRLNVLSGMDSLIYSLATDNVQEREWGTISTDAYYELKLDSSGQKLNFDVSVDRFGRQQTNDVLTRITEGSAGEVFPNRRQNTPGNTWIYAGKIDYTLLVNEVGRFSAGLKASRAELDNDLQADIFNNGEWIDDPGFSNQFLFDESIYAAYGSYGYEKGAWQFNAGLRYEISDTRGYSITLDSTINRDVNQLFPSLSLNGPLAGAVGWSAAYSYRIDRPSYSSLNPFVYVMDPFTYQTGNPGLRPEFTHSTQLSVTYDKQPFFNLEYSQSNDVIQLITSQDSATGIAFGIDENLDLQERYGGSLFFPLTFVKGLDGYGGFMLHYNRYESSVFGEQFNQGIWNWVTFFQANYKVNDRVGLELGGWMVGPGLEGVMRYNRMGGMSAGAEYKFWDNDASIRVSCDDMFVKFWSAEVEYAGFNAQLENRWEAPVVNVQFTYSFGNKYLKKEDRPQSSADDLRQRNSEKN